MSTLAPYGIIYLTCRVHGGQVVKRYIGQHKVYGGILEDGYLGSGVLLTRAIKKYGREAFTREVLEVCYSRKELNLAEKKWIAEYNATECPTFYNLAEGGGSCGNIILRKTVYKFSLEGKFLEKFSSVVEAAASAGCSEAQMTLTCKSPLGKRRTARRAVWSFDPTPPEGATKEGVTRQVHAYTQEGVFVKSFDSVTKASKFIGENTTGNIIACAKGKKRSAGGYQWSYNLEKMSPLGRLQRGQKKVLQIDRRTGEVLGEFDSCTDAARAVGAHPANLARAKRTHFAAAGFLWREA